MNENYKKIREENQEKLKKILLERKKIDRKLRKIYLEEKKIEKLLNSKQVSL
jgi:hypothetical protein